MSISRINKVLIANRGEIACRVIKTARRLGIETVAVFSEPDKHSLHVGMANEAYCIGPAASQQSYLRGDKILEVAERSKSQAVHPGYGFLSENVEFAAMCKQRNVIFIGPPESAIRDMGIKNTSKEIMERAGVPVVRGYHGTEQSAEFLLERAREIGFPVMIKAVRGGGGKGMRVCMGESEFSEQLESAKREALKAFNDDAMLLEKYIERPRHVEVQVFGDQHGNYVHLCERDCSVQRRHQKIIEEAPGPQISDELRQKLGEAAVKAAAAVSYVGAGTVEFIMDARGDFYFMEMNTRLQVEHPVTEMITRQDLVEWQLRVAAGEKLPVIDQSKLSKPFGHAFEARIYAEDCSSPAHFFPTAGTISLLRPPNPEDNSVRIDTGVIEGDEISVHYDPMISKLIVWSHNREAALTKLTQTLRSYHILGLPTNISFLTHLSQHPQFILGDVHTDFIKQHEATLFPRQTDSIKVPDQTLAIGGLSFLTRNLLNNVNKPTEDIYSPFHSIDCFRINHSFTKHIVLCQKDESSSTNKVSVTKNDQSNKYHIKVNDESEYSVEIIKKSNDRLRVCFDDIEMQEYSIYNGDSCDELYLVDNGGNRYEFVDETVKKGLVLGDSSTDSSLGTDSSLSRNQATAPMPGVIERILVSPGQQVDKGQVLLTLVAMKMEYSVRSGCQATVSEILVDAGKSVPKNQVLVKLKPINEEGDDK